MLIALVCGLIAVHVACHLRFLITVVLEVLIGRSPTPPLPNLATWPRIAIQLACYREHKVLGALLEAVLDMKAPSGVMTVQVIDDSTDPDAKLTQAVVAACSERGTPVEYINRGSRAGFKAGALNHGLGRTDAELVAFFDADCKPERDFLARTVPYFADPSVIAVQARWDYHNALQSPLNQLQSAFFEWLFRCEITPRARLGLPVFYMGTAAVWRAEGIRKLGGWQEEPFTCEDLDLAYRAGNAGYKVLYQSEKLATTTAVDDLLAFRAQQRRWARCMLQVGLDNFPKLLRMERSFTGKFIEFTMFMTHGAGLAFMVAALVSGIAVLAGAARSWNWLVMQTVFSASVILSPVVAAMAFTQRSYHRDWLARTWLLMRALPESSGMVTSFLFGLFDLSLGRSGEFTTTPKGGVFGLVQGSPHKWMTKHLGPLMVDGVSGVFFLVAAVTAGASGYPEAIIPLTAAGLPLIASALHTTRELRLHSARLHTAAAGANR